MNGASNVKMYFCWIFIVCVMSGCVSYQSKPQLALDCGFDIANYFDELAINDGELYDVFQWIRTNVYGGIALRPNLPPRAKPRLDGPELVHKIETAYFRYKKAGVTNPDVYLIWKVHERHTRSGYYLIWSRNNKFFIAGVNDEGDINALFNEDELQFSGDLRYAFRPLVKRCY